MISTVTTSTVTTVTTMVAGFGIAIGIAAVVTLIGFLCVRELVGASDNGPQRFLARSLNVAILPLIIVFGMIVIMEVVRILV